MSPSDNLLETQFKNWVSSVKFGITTELRQSKSGSIDYTPLNALTLDISNATSSSKLKYDERIANNLNDPKTAPKTYWSSWKYL